MASAGGSKNPAPDDSPLGKHEYLTDDDEYDPANVTFSDCEDNEFSGEIPDYDSPLDSEEEDPYEHPVADTDESSPPPQPIPARQASLPPVAAQPQEEEKKRKEESPKEEEKQEEVKKDKKSKKKNKKKKKKGKREGNAPVDGNPDVRRPRPDEENPQLNVPADVVDAATYREFSDDSSEISEQDPRRMLRARRRMPAGGSPQGHLAAGPVHNPYENIPADQHGGRLMDVYDYQQGNYSTENVSYIPEGSHGGGMMNVPPDMGYSQGLYEHYWAGTQDCFRPLIMQMMAAPLPPGTGVQAYRTMPNIFPKGPPTFNRQFDGSDIVLVSNDAAEFHCHYSLLASQCWRFPQYPMDTGRITLPYKGLVILRALQIFYGVSENLWEPLSDQDIVELSGFYAYTAATLVFNYCYLTVQRWTFDRQVRYYLCTLDKFPIHKVFLLWLVAAKPEAALKVIEKFYAESQDKDKVLSWEDIFWVSWMCYKISGVILKP